MMAAQKEMYERLQHQMNCLSSENRAVRKSALLSLKQYLSKTSSWKEDDLGISYDDFIKTLLVAFSDSSEACRDISISVLQGFLLRISSKSEYLSTVVPVLVARLGQTEIVEPSEEIRLNLMSFIVELAQSCTTEMAPFIGDIVLILRQTLCDPFPEVKKASAMCVASVVQQNPVAFYRQGETLVKPLLKGMTHQHSKVRVDCLKALGCAIEHLPAAALDEAFPVLAQKTYDASAAVRKCLIQTLESWLLRLVDRYSYHHKLVPLLLTCLSDDSEELREQAKEAWLHVGKLFEGENEADLRDQLDFSLSLDVPSLMEYDRPSLGCRVIVQRNFHKFLPSLLRDLSDWQTMSRIKASQLLCTSLIHLEEHITQSLHDLLTALYHTCCDEDQVVATHAIRCSSIIGCYVPADVWCNLAIAAVKTASGSTGHGGIVDSSVAVGQQQCEGCLLCFAGLLQGGKKDQIFAELNSILSCLCDQEIFATKHWGTIKGISLCAEKVLDIGFKMDSAQESCFLMILLRLAATQMEDDLWHKKVQSNVVKLCKCQGYPDAASIFLQNGRDVLLPIVVDCKHWTSLSPKHLLFLSCLKQFKSSVISFLDIIVPAFSVCLSAGSEAEIQLSYVAVLLELIMEPQTEEQRSAFCQQSEAIVRDIIVPNTVWAAGRTASALRASLMSCLQALLELSLLQQESTNRVLDTLLPQVLSCLDDQNGSTRLASGHVLKCLLYMKPSSLTVDCLHVMYPHILKRLDDINEDVRMQSTDTLVAYVNCLPDQYDGLLYKSHCEVLYTTLLIHLDDSSEQMQDAIFKVLKDASRLNKELLKTCTANVRGMHKTAKFCDALLEHLST